MSRFHPLALLPLACALLAACSGGSSSDDGRLGSFAAIEREALRLARASEGLDYTDPASLPRTGSATYEGVIGLDLDDRFYNDTADYDIGGQLRLNAGFAGNSVTGSATNFYTATNQPLGGTLRITNGVIDRGADVFSEYTWDADIAGTLTGERNGPMAIDGVVLGDFFGPGATFVGGIVEGDACQRGVCTGFDGNFGGQRR
jgi:hypothetical protein